MASTPSSSDSPTRVSRVYMAIFAVVTLLILGVMVRAIYIQWTGEELRKKARSVVYKSVRVEPVRGSLLAVDGRMLATSVPSYNLYVDMKAASGKPREFKMGLDSLARGLAGIFQDRPASWYRSYLEGKYNHGDQYVKLGSRAVNGVELQQVRQLPVLRKSRYEGGVMTEKHPQRSYLLGGLARRTIGPLKGGEPVGLEGAYGSLLRGTPGKRTMKKAPGGSWIPATPVIAQLPVDGIDVITTIDINLQDVLTEALRTQLIQEEAAYGCAVLMEVASGEVKAIANLTRQRNGGYEETLNHAIEQRAEPGSTFKVAALMALLDDRKITIDDSVDTQNGKITVRGVTFQDTKEGGYGKITVKRAVEVSSNVAMIRLVWNAYGQQPDALIARLKGQRWDQPLGTPIPREQSPLLTTPASEAWSAITTASLGIGYAVAVSPIQMLTFYNAIANNGCMVRPRFIKAQAQNGEIIKRYGPEVLAASICSKSTLRQLRACLEGVVDSGTGSELRDSNYRVAGKTGTARVSRGAVGYAQGGYQASFVGYFPADNPKYSCIVVVHDPKKKYYGGKVAAPIFKAVVEKIFFSRPEWFQRLEPYQGVPLPESKAGDAHYLATALDELGVEVATGDYRQGWVGTHREDGAVCFSQRPDQPKGRVPNVVGMALADAIYYLESRGLQVKVRGRGAVRGQTPAAGSTIREGGTVVLSMSQTQ